MNNLKTYNEYLNEGFYNFMTRPISKKDELFMALSVLALIFSGIYLILGFTDANTSDSYNWFVGLIISFFVGIPLAKFLFKQIFKNPYHALRSKLFIKKANEINKNLQQYLEKYPDIEEDLRKIKIEMSYSIKNKNKAGISKNIHELYELSKQIKVRDKADSFFEFNDDEKAEMLKKIKDRKNLDPLGEEDWNE